MKSKKLPFSRLRLIVAVIGLLFFVGSLYYFRPSRQASHYPPRPAQLLIEDLEIGKGAEAVTGKKVAVRYVGWFYDPLQPGAHGKQFDSSLERGAPFEFGLGAKQVIPAWEQGLQTMREGGKRRLIVPSTLGYGAAGAGTIIPPDSDLVFEIDLISVK